MNSVDWARSGQVREGEPGHRRRTRSCSIRTRWPRRSSRSPEASNAAGGKGQLACRRRAAACRSGSAGRRSRRCPACPAPYPVSGRAEAAPRCAEITQQRAVWRRGRARARPQVGAVSTSRRSVGQSPVSAHARRRRRAPPPSRPPKRGSSGTPGGRGEQHRAGAGGVGDEPAYAGRPGRRGAQRGRARPGAGPAGRPASAATRPRRARRDAAPCAKAAFSPAPAAVRHGAGAERAPARRPRRGSSVTTSTSATAGAGQRGGRRCRAARPAPASSCRTPGTAPRSRLFAALSRLTGTTTVQVRSPPAHPASRSRRYPCAGRPAAASRHDFAAGRWRAARGAAGAARQGGTVARRRLGFWRRFAVVLVKPVADGSGPSAPGPGMEHIPATGGVIIVPNHISHADPLVVAHYVYDAGRWPQFLGKASLFQVPVVGYILRKCQQIPVERGSVDAVRRSTTLVDGGQRRRRGGHLPGGHHHPGARPVADAGQDRRGPAGPGHRCAGDPDRDVGRRADVRPAYQQARAAAADPGARWPPARRST